MAGTPAAHPFLVCVMALLRGGVGALDEDGVHVFAPHMFAFEGAELPSWDCAHDWLVRGLMINVAGRARDGLASVRLERRTEPAYTAVLSAYMQRFVALRGLTNVTVVHQAPDGRDGKIDIAVCLMEPPGGGGSLDDVGCPLAVAIGEGASDLADKEGQLTSYALRIDKGCSKSGGDPILLGFIAKGLGSPAQSLQVVALYKVEDGKYGRAVLLPDTRVESVLWKRFLLAIEFFCRHVGAVRAGSRGTPYWPRYANATLLGAHFVKVFDYAGREGIDPRSCRRGIASRDLDGYEEILKVGSLCVIKLSRLPGAHRMSRIEHGVSLVRALEGFWGDQEGDPCIHSDIRLSNLLFDEDSGACVIIDRDYAGRRSEEREYPPNWNREIRDGGRDAGASAFQRHELSHDAFAAAAVMRLYVPDSTAAAAAWGAACDHVAAMRLTGACSVLIGLDPRTALRLADASLTLDMRGTGSPPKAT